MVDESLAWADSAGLDVVRKGTRWRIHLQLETHGETPKLVWDLKTPRFWLTVRGTAWVVGLTLAHGEVWFLKKTGEKGERGHCTLDLAPPTTLANVRPWLARAEKTLGVQFDRQRPRVQSNVKGGAAAMGKWIATM